MPRKRASKPNAVQTALIELRSALGVTQEQFAREIGVTSVTVARWETTRSPGFAVLSRLADYAATKNQMELAKRFLDEKLKRSQFAISLSVASVEIAGMLLRTLLETETNREKRKLIKQALQLIDLSSLTDSMKD